MGMYGALNLELHKLGSSDSFQNSQFSEFTAFINHGRGVSGWRPRCLLSLCCRCCVLVIIQSRKLGCWRRSWQLFCCWNRLWWSPLFSAQTSISKPPWRQPQLQFRSLPGGSLNFKGKTSLTSAFSINSTGVTHDASCAAVIQGPFKQGLRDHIRHCEYTHAHIESWRARSCRISSRTHSMCNFSANYHVEDLPPFQA